MQIQNCKCKEVRDRILIALPKVISAFIPVMKVEQDKSSANK